MGSKISETTTSALRPHGTPERWQAGCDCWECCEAMRTVIHESDIESNSSWTLGYMLDFRVHGCELYVVPGTLSERAGICQATVRRRIDKLIEFGALSKIAGIEGKSGRAGIYLLHAEKLKMSSHIRLYREHERLVQEGKFTQVTAWRLMLLKEHEPGSAKRTGFQESFLNRRCRMSWIVWEKQEWIISNLAVSWLVD
jgi:hypothetical protein